LRANGSHKAPPDDELPAITRPRHTPPPGLAFGEPMDADPAMRLLTEERVEAAS